jgi:hypothetical protein
MKKLITITCIALSAIIILDSFNAWHALIMFYLAGEIPGTRKSISASTMLQIFALLTGFVVARIGNHALQPVFEKFEKTSFKRTVSTTN